MINTATRVSLARLVALILNALYGVEKYYETHHKSLNVDGFFGLRIIEGQLDMLYKDLHSVGIDQKVLEEIRNLSAKACSIAELSVPYLQEKQPKYFFKFQSLLSRPYTFKWRQLQTDRRYIWNNDELLPTNPVNTLYVSEEDQSDRCFAELLSKKLPDGHLRAVCNISDLCMEKMVHTRGLSGYRLTHQVLFASISLLV
ncbi:hypothetical protein AB6A40_001604 [Gnathostoma spinigerum]|uniref:Uncharacterized protein n=1 Tax=Gnathostoma spinigerum TaxID=75299 RepID=A0ABD6EEY6_9BILA